MKHFHQDFALMFSSLRARCRLERFCLKILCWKFSQGTGALLAAWEFTTRLVSQTDIFVGFASRQGCITNKGVGNR